jgi:RNA:NAD 2'-phosphotransferase (TPT1/KptA family)
LAGAAKNDFPISREELIQVVAENDKQRFSFDDSQPDRCGGVPRYVFVTPNPTE